MNDDTRGLLMLLSQIYESLDYEVFYSAEDLDPQNIKTLIKFLNENDIVIK